MPLIKGKKSCSKKGKSKNISAEIRSGRPLDEALEEYLERQAVAIAMETCRRSNKKTKKGKSR